LSGRHCDHCILGPPDQRGRNRSDRWRELTRPSGPGQEETSSPVPSSEGHAQSRGRQHSWRLSEV